MYSRSCGGAFRSVCFSSFCSCHFLVECNKFLMISVLFARVLLTFGEYWRYSNGARIFHWLMNTTKTTKTHTETPTSDLNMVEWEFTTLICLLFLLWLYSYRWHWKRQTQLESAHKSNPMNHPTQQPDIFEYTPFSIKCKSHMVWGNRFFVHPQASRKQAPIFRYITITDWCLNT